MDRVVAVYLSHTGSTTPFGAIRWFASKVGRDYSTVWRWAHGQHPPNEDAMRILRRMERHPPESTSRKEDR